MTTNQKWILIFLILSNSKKQTKIKRKPIVVGFNRFLKFKIRILPSSWEFWWQCYLSLDAKYPLYRVVLWHHSYINTVLPDSVIQNIVKFFVKNSHDFVEWTWEIQSEYETLINHSASKPRIQSEWKTTLELFNNYVNRILPSFKPGLL